MYNIYCSGIGPNNILRTKQKTVDMVSLCMGSIFYTCSGRERETVGMVNKKLLHKKYTFAGTINFFKKCGGWDKKDNFPSGWDLAELWMRSTNWLHVTAAFVCECQGRNSPVFNPASSETVETEGRQAKQCENTSILLAKTVGNFFKKFIGYVPLEKMGV